MGFSLAHITNSFANGVAGLGAKGDPLLKYDTGIVKKVVNGINDRYVDPQSPAVPDAPAAPTIDASQTAAEAASDALRRRRGMAATILGGAQPQSATMPTTRAAALLGS
jgi:hypothetical protein